MSEMELRERIARLEEKVNALEAKVDLILQLLQSRNNYMKWMMAMLGMILSFIAALFGIGWRP